MAFLYLWMTEMHMQSAKELPECYRFGSKKTWPGKS